MASCWKILVEVGKLASHMYKFVAGHVIQRMCTDDIIARGLLIACMRHRQVTAVENRSELQSMAFLVSQPPVSAAWSMRSSTGLSLCMTAIVLVALLASSCSKMMVTTLIAWGG